MSSCLGVRLGAAAVVGYSLGAVVGGATVAWVVAVVAAGVAYVASRLWAGRAGATCGGACRTPTSGAATPDGVRTEASERQPT